MGPIYPGLVALWRLTAVPAPRGLEPTAEDLARSAWWFPVVGAAIGIALATLAWFLAVVDLVPALAAIAVAIAAVIATRAAHEIGLASAAEAFGGARDRLSDSGITSWGVMALVAVLALRAGGLMGMSPEVWLAALVISQACSRWAVLALLKWTERSPDTRPESSDIASMRAPSWTVIGVAGLAVAVPAVALGRGTGLAIALVAAAIVSGVGFLFQWRNQTVTQAHLGAVACACELGILLAFAAVAPAVLSPWASALAQ